MQRLQPNCMTDSLRNLMFTKHNGDNAKVRIFSFILQRQPIQPNFMTVAWEESYITNNQTPKRNSNDKNNNIILGFTINTNFELLQLRQRKFCSIHT